MNRFAHDFLNWELMEDTGITDVFAERQTDEIGGMIDMYYAGKYHLGNEWCKYYSNLKNFDFFDLKHGKLMDEFVNSIGRGVVYEIDIPLHLIFDSDIDGQLFAQLIDGERNPLVSPLPDKIPRIIFSQPLSEFQYQVDTGEDVLTKFYKKGELPLPAGG